MGMGRGRAGIAAFVAIAMVAQGGAATAAARASATLTVRADRVSTAVGSATETQAATGAKVRAGTTVTTDATGVGELRYPDKSLARLGPSTTLTVAKLGKKEGAVARQGVGDSWHRVTKASSSQDRYEVATPNANASVRGTKFAVRCDLARTCRFLVVGGRVVVETAGGQRFVVGPGQAVFVGPDGRSPGVVAFTSDPFVDANLAIDAGRDPSVSGLSRRVSNPATLPAADVAGTTAGRVTTQPARAGATAPGPTGGDAAGDPTGGASPGETPPPGPPGPPGPPVDPPVDPPEETPPPGPIQPPVDVPDPTPPGFTDADTDGIIDAIEDGAPNGGDGNGDSIPDSAQANVASVPNAVTSAYVTVVSPPGTALVDVAPQTVPGSPAPPGGVAFPVGLVAFDVLVTPAGSAASVDIILPAGTAPTDYWTLHGGTWAQFSGMMTIAGDTVTLLLMDGGVGDRDGLSNGVIAHRGGAAVATSPTPEVVPLAVVTSGVEPVVLAGGEVVVLVDEFDQGEDLNGDGDTNDFVPHVWTGIGPVVNLGVAAYELGTPVALDSGGVVFLVDETAQDSTDLNGDGDAVDFVPHVWTGSLPLVNLGAAASEVTPPAALNGGAVAFLGDELAQGEDLNGDLDLNDTVPLVWMGSLPLTNLATAAQPGSSLVAIGGGVAFRASESDQGGVGTDLNGDGDTADAVPQVWLGLFPLVNLGVAGSELLVLRNEAGLAFIADEAAQQADLNGDGDQLDGVAQVWQGALPLTNLSIATYGGSLMAALDGGGLALVAYEPGEGPGGTDLNGDGDTGDVVPQIFTGSLPLINLAVAQDAQPVLALSGGDAAFLADEFSQQADLNGDGDQNDVVPQWWSGSLPPTNSTVASFNDNWAALDGGGLAFVAWEVAQQVDLNGDGDALDVVPMEWTSAVPTSLGGVVTGAPVALVGGGIAYQRPETIPGTDLNDDGDQLDFVPQTWPGALPVVNTGLASGVSTGFGALPSGGFVFVASEFENGLDLNGDGDQSDWVLAVWNG